MHLPPVPGVARPALASAVALLGLAGLPAAADKESPLEANAEAALRKIEARPKAAPEDAPRLRRDLLALRLAYPGTRAGIKAAAALGRLPSALDRMEARTIPEMEKFSWQPRELVGVLGEHRGRHGAPVAGLAFSADNKVLISGGGPYVRVWDAATMRLIDLSGLGSVSSVAISKDQKLVAAGSHHGAVGVWEFVDGKNLRFRYSVQAATSAVYAVACHPDGKRVAAACFDNVARVYDVSGPAAREVGQATGHTKAVLGVAFSPDGKTLATGSDDQTARTWDATTADFKERSRLEGHTAAVGAVAFSPSGKTLTTGCADGSVRFWGVPAAARARAPKLTHQGSRGPITSLSYSASGLTLAATSNDAVVRVWSLKSGKPIERFRLAGHADPAAVVAFSPDSRLLASGGADHTVRTWDMTRARPAERFVPASHLSHAYSVAFAPDDQTLASGSLDRVVRFWDLDRPAPRTRNYLKGDAVAVYAVAYSPDGRLVAAAGAAARVRQWDAKTGATRPACAGHPTSVSAMTYSADGRYLLTASGKVSLLFDAARGTEVSRFTKHETNITCLALTPDGRQALTGSGYYLYDKDGKIVTRDGKVVYTDCTLRLWDADRAEELTVVKDAATPFYSAAVSADGGRVWAGNYAAALRRFRLRGTSLAERPALKGSGGYPDLVLPSADGRRLLTRGLDGKLTLWDLATDRPLHAWTFNEVIGGVALTTDGRHLAVGLGTGVIYVLRVGGPAQGKGGA